MKSLDEQFADIIKPRLAQLQDRVAVPLAEDIDKRMKENTAQGHGFANDPYDNRYSESHAATRRAKGFQTSTVELRMKDRRIESTAKTKQSVTKAGRTAEGVRISFNDDKGGRIMQFHHTGRAKGGKIRSIFPKAPESIPEDILQQNRQRLTEVLRGK